MAAFVIPWPQLPEWEQSVQLDATSYRLRARYNILNGGWVIDILTADKISLVEGIRLVRGALLTHYHVDPRLPPGDFIVIGNEEPNRSNMGTLVNLIYDTPEL